MSKEWNGKRNKKLKIRMKSLLEEACAVPAPERKDEFIRKYRRAAGRRKISSWNILREQAGYIRKWVWLVTGLALLLGVAQVHAGGERVITIVAAVMPFVSGLAVLESFRSGLYGMAELEGVTRLSLRGVLFARMTVIGGVHLVLIVLLILLIGGKNEYGYAMTGAFIAIPYLMASILSMEAERTAFGRKNSLVSLGISALVSIVVIMAREQGRIFLYAYRGLWIAGLVFLIGMEIYETRKLFRWEEYTWN